MFDWQHFRYCLISQCYKLSVSEESTMLYGGLSPLVQRNRTRRCSSNASVSLFSTSEVGQWSGAAPARASMAGWNQGKICKNRVFSVEWFIRTFWPEWLSQLISHVLQSLLRAARVYAKPPFVCYVFVNTDVSVATLFCHCSVVDWSLCGIIIWLQWLYFPEGANQALGQTQFLCILFIQSIFGVCTCLVITK